MQRYQFKTRPIANPKAVVGGGNEPYRFTLLTGGLIRYEYAEDGMFEDRASTFAVFREQPVPPFRVVEQDTKLEIITDYFHLYYDKGKFSPNGLKVQVKGDVTASSSMWRYGYHHEDERYVLGGTARTLDKVNGRTELGESVINRDGYAEIDDSGSMLFTDDGWIAGRKPCAKGPRVDGYLFAYGLDYRAAIKALYAVSGSQPLIPRWALGNWWSRYHKYSDMEYLDLMARFKDEGIPFSVGVMDMDWHWVDDQRVRDAGVSGWTGYSWNTDLFPKPKEFLQELHQMGLKVPVCDHPADGVSNYEDVYQRVCEAVGRDPATKDPVPFNITDKTYVDAYFDIVLRNLEDDGVDFFWQDWQQGPFSDIPGVDPLWPINHFHFMNKTRESERPFIFSRFAGPGNQRYPCGFSGDTHITWDSLNFQPEFTATASNIGFGWWSNDIGGHMHGYRDDELAARWVQLGVFSPILRLHSTNNPWMTKEPWNYPAEAKDAMIKALRFRHRLVPYLYSMNVRSAKEDEPLVQPLYWHWPKREEAYSNKNTFLFGSELFVAPLTSPATKATGRAKTSIWLPPGRHVDISSGMIYSGGRMVKMYRKLDEYIALAKTGSIIPLDASSHPSFGTANPKALEVLVVVGADAKFSLYEDDGKGATVVDAALHETHMSYNDADGVFEMHMQNSTERSPFKERHWLFTFLGLDPERLLSVFIDGASSAFEMQRNKLGLSVRLHNVPTSSKVEIKLGSNPQLRANDVLSGIFQVVDEAQMPYDPKKQIWATVSDETLAKNGLKFGSSDDHSLSRKVAQLSTLTMDDDVRGAIMEYLTAD